MLRTIVSLLGLAVLWLLMSGIYDKALVLGLGAFSVILSVYLVYRMDKVDDHKLGFNLSAFALLRYACWLMVEIAKSNWAVTKIIFSGKTPSRQKLVIVPVSEKTEIGQVIFANSITLTPGTITVETEDDYFLVHALDYDQGDMASFAEMDAQVKKVETC